MENSITTQKVFPALIGFTLPLILTGLLQQFYSIVDSLIVGRWVGETALASLGCSNPVTNGLVYLAMALVSGCTILIAHHYGSGKFRQIGQIALSFTVMMLILGVLVAVGGIAARQHILVLLDTPTEAFAYAEIYLGYVFLGVPFIALYNVSAAVLRGIGDSKTSFWSILVACLINIPLDLFFVVTLNWGIGGAALATVLAQAVSGIYVFAVMLSKLKGFDFKLKRDGFNLPLFAHGLRLSLPQVVQSSIVAAGSFVLQGVTNSFGETTVAGITTAYKLDSLILLPMTNASTAVSVFTGQNLGAGNTDRAKQGLRCGMIFNAIFSAVAIILIVFFGRQLISLFGVGEETSYLGYRFLCTCSFFYIFFAVNNACVGFLQGAKDVFFPAAISIVALGIRVALSFLWKDWLGTDVIAIAEVLSWVFAAIATYWRYRYLVKYKLAVE